MLKTLGAAALIRPCAGAAQRLPAVPRIGLLMGASPAVEAHRLSAFRQALEQLGYSDGKDVAIELRYAEGRAERFDGLARELVALAPAVIACVGQPETTALQRATRTIPIVFMQINDPVEQGFVASLARPGGNTTGFTQMSAELDPKRLQLLHEIMPSLSHAVFLINPTLTPRLAERFAHAEAAAKSLGIALRRIDVAAPAELDAAFAAIEAAAAEALLIEGDPLLSGTQFPRILDFAMAHRLAVVSENATHPRAGSLLSYAPDLDDNARLAAGYVARILKGAKPADLPVQNPTKFLLVINLKTADKLGLKVPQSLLQRADEVIE